MDSEKEKEGICCIRREAILVCGSVNVAVWYFDKRSYKNGGNFVDLHPWGL